MNTHYKNRPMIVIIGRSVCRKSPAKAGLFRQTEKPRSRPERSAARLRLQGDLIQYDGLDRFDQSHNVGSINKGDGFSIHNSQTQAAVIAVKLDLDLGEVLVVQIDDQTDFFFLGRCFVGEAVGRQSHQCALQIANIQFFLAVIPNASGVLIFIVRSGGKGVLFAFQRNVDLGDSCLLYTSPSPRD